MERVIKNFENYSIDSSGTVKNLTRGSVLKPQVSKKGYAQVSLYVNNKPKKFFVHRLVAECFLELIPNKNIVNHKDGNKLNNSVSNLEWADDSENRVHAIKTGLAPVKIGSDVITSKLDETKVEMLLTLFLKNRNVKEISELTISMGMKQGSYVKILNNISWKHVLSESRELVKEIYCEQKITRERNGRTVKVHTPPSRINNDWTGISGFETTHLVNSIGEIFSTVRGTILKQTFSDGYKIITIRSGEKSKTLKVHRIVADTFINNPENKPYVNHKNKIRDDNRVVNLEWVTQQENMRHSADFDLFKIE